MNAIDIVLIVLAVLVGLVVLRWLFALALFTLGFVLMGIADLLDRKAEKRRLRARRR